LSQLFSKFASKSDKGGTRLELFIAKNIVEVHSGGKIWAENNNNNTDDKNNTHREKGYTTTTTFYFTLLYFTLSTTTNQLLSLKVFVDQ